MNFGPSIKEYHGKTIGLYGGKFFPFHKGHLESIMQAQSMVDVLFVVVGVDPEHERKLCEGTKFEYVNERIRERWITEELKEFANIRVLSHYEKRCEDYMTNPAVAESYKDLIVKIGGKVDLVFSSEIEYNDYFEKYLPMAKHVVIDSEREKYPISATAIREKGVYDKDIWDYLPKAVQKHYTKRVVICGIESAGKTHLCKMMASMLNTKFAYEYGRQYYEEINGYNDISIPMDYVDIGVGHTHLLNKQAEEANKILIADTDLVYTQFFHYLEHKEYNGVIDSLIKSKGEKFDKYIYIEPHNFHELDGTRREVTKKEREYRNNLLKNIYNEYGIELVIIDQVDRNERFKDLIYEVNSMLN